MSDKHQNNTAKRLAGSAALDAYVTSGMCVGLGSGSTVELMVYELGKRVRNGLVIRTVATSVRTEKLAKEQGICVIPLEQCDNIDVTIDGADEILLDNLSMIKGGGGCLLWEKIIAKASKKVVTIVNESKCVRTLGSFPLPLEVIPFGRKITQKMATSYLGNASSTWRKLSGGNDFVTDSGHFILDVICKEALKEPEVCEQDLNSIPGVVENGLFCGIATDVFVGFAGNEKREPYVLQGEEAASAFKASITTLKA